MSAYNDFIQGRNKKAAGVKEIRELYDDFVRKFQVSRF